MESLASPLHLPFERFTERGTSTACWVSCYPPPHITHVHRSPTTTYESTVQQQGRSLSLSLNPYWLSHPWTLPAFVCWNTQPKLEAQLLWAENSVPTWWAFVLLLGHPSFPTERVYRHWQGDYVHIHTFGVAKMVAAVGDFHGRITISEYIRYRDSERNRNRGSIIVLHINMSWQTWHVVKTLNKYISFTTIMVEFNEQMCTVW